MIDEIVQNLALLYERAPHDVKPSSEGVDTGQVATGVSVAALAVRVLSLCCCLGPDGGEPSGEAGGVDELSALLAASARTTLADILTSAASLEELVAGRVLQVALPMSACMPPMDTGWSQLCAAPNAARPRHRLHCFAHRFLRHRYCRWRAPAGSCTRG